eukprot:15136457-Ditylum_brightwellii.AAC.1
MAEQELRISPIDSGQQICPMLASVSGWNEPPLGVRTKVGCGLGSGSLVSLSSSNGMTCDWGGLLITLGGGTLKLGCVAFSKMLDNFQIACNCSSPSAAKGAL